MKHPVYLIRHGETAWAASGRHTGWTDEPLTAAGRRQARGLRGRLASIRFKLVLVSPLSRAMDTACLAGLRPAPKPCLDLEEWNYGDYEGLTTPQILKAVPGWDLWTDGCPGGEAAPQVGARADDVLRRIAKARGPVALVAHGHLLRVLAARWLGLPPTAGKFLALDTASVSILGHEHEQPVIQSWNLTAS